MKFDNQLRYAVKVVEAFKGEMPLHAWLKNFFREHPQMGSKDRKLLANMVYGFYRLGHAATKLSVEERIVTGLFLGSPDSSQILQYFKPEWNVQVALSLKEKYALAGMTDQLPAIFPWKEACSEGMEHLPFCESFLTQPDLFLRLRPGKEAIVLQKLAAAGIAYCLMASSCIALHNATKVDAVIELNKEAVVQDYSSQRVGDFLRLPENAVQRYTAWDCCAASGGKSIMLYDMHPSIELTVSDIRESIVVNLKKRFAEAGIKNYRSFIADLSAINPRQSTSQYDIVIADVPCSGSGTWSRTPEALYFFKEAEIQVYSDLQKKIVSSIIPSLKKNGKLVYITCSVFKKENEELVDYIQQKFHLKLEKQELLQGYTHRADTMFAASFTK